LPQATVDQELLNIAEADAMRQDRHAELITFLDFAMIPERVKPPSMILPSCFSAF
jgi:hypothetical protein